MSMEEATRTANKACMAAALLLAIPAFAHRAAGAPAKSGSPLLAVYVEQSQRGSSAERDEDLQDQEQEKRDREQEKRERLSELYEDGREALDDNRYDKAEAKFDQLVQMNGPQTDAAL